MKDAYEVLGIYHTASDDEVKQAYKEMLRKYHPDNYVGTNNPLVPLAEEKFKEAQEAYNEIMKVRAQGYYGPLGPDNEPRSSNPFGQGNVNRGPFSQPGGNGYTGQNGAPGGGVFGGQGGPGGGKYQQPYQQNYQQNGNYYGRPANYHGTDSCGTGNLCCDLWCADTLCECMGGDICSCL
ncbi:MAG: J domain-containing protein [Lachnospiraceae bacterium]|nr:J domain-containing protein [Lachnospiraceae bacterium]